MLEHQSPCEKLKSVEKDLERIEEMQKKHTIYISELKETKAETAIYVKQILTRLDKLQENINDLFNREGKMTTKDWIGLVKWIIGGTLFYLIAYSI